MIAIVRMGQLGVLASSERYKTSVTSMSSESEKLQQLRPVTFHLKTDPQGALQYGLIAEEVDKVYPDLVVRDEAGTIQGVRYDELAPILLNEVQQQRQELNAEVKQRRDMQLQLEELKEQNQSILAAMAKLQAPDQRVAMR